jgi:hypothetical protein
VRLNIRETERRRRRRSMIDLEQEEERHSDDEGGDVAEATESLQDQRLPPRRTTNIRPRPPSTQASQRQMDYRSSPSTSPTHAPQQRQDSPPSPSSALGYNRHRPRQDPSEDDDYEEEPSRRPGRGTEMMDCDESSSRYTHTDRVRNPSRPSINSGIPAYQAFTYSNASASFDPAPSSSPQSQPPLQSSSPIQTHYDYGVSLQPPPHHTPFAHSGMRSSIHNVSMFEDSQNAPTGTAAFSRYGSSSRRDSDSGSSTTSRRSGGSVGSTGEVQGTTSSFVYGMGGGH